MSPIEQTKNRNKKNEKKEDLNTLKRILKSVQIFRRCEVADVLRREQNSKCVENLINTIEQLEGELTVDDELIEIISIKIKEEQP